MIKGKETEKLPDWWHDITFEVVEKKTVTTQLAGKEPKGNIADEVVKC